MYGDLKSKKDRMAPHKSKVTSESILGKLMNSRLSEKKVGAMDKALAKMRGKRK